MPLDITTTISEFNPAHKYQVLAYREGSNIPIKLVTKEANDGSGPTAVIKELPDGYNYDIEVIHYDGDKQCSSRKRAFTLSGGGGCSCPQGYTANTDNTKCVRTTTEQAAATGVTTNVGAGPDEGAYCRDGARVYAPGYPSTGYGASLWDSGITNEYWASGNTTLRGRLNLAGVWNSASGSLPLNTWIGFAKKVVVPTSKVYYIGMAGDNYVRFKVNGQVIIDQRTYAGSVPNNYNFNYWHIFPVFLNAGDNIIELEGYNNGSLGCFAAEIYNCDLFAIQNVTTSTEATLNRIFTTLGQTEFDTEYSCKPGWALDTTTVPVSCKLIEYTACQ